MYLIDSILRLFEWLFICRHDATVMEFRQGEMYLRCCNCMKRSKGVKV